MWWNLNSRHGMDEEIIDYITRSSHPSLEIFDETIEETWSFYSYLTVNAIHFYDLRRSTLFKYLVHVIKASDGMSSY